MDETAHQRLGHPIAAAGQTPSMLSMRSAGLARQIWFWVGFAAVTAAILISDLPGGRPPWPRASAPGGPAPARALRGRARKRIGEIRVSARPAHAGARRHFSCCGIPLIPAWCTRSTNGSRVSIARRVPRFSTSWMRRDWRWRPATGTRKRVSSESTVLSPLFPGGDAARERPVLRDRHDQRGSRLLFRPCAARRRTHAGRRRAQGEYRPP